MDSFYDLWRQVSASLKDELGETIHNVWISCIVPIEMTASELLLKVPSNMHRDVIAGRFSGNIRKTVKDLTGIDISLKLITDDELKNMSTLPPEFSEESSEYTFDSFIVGSSNRFAHAAAQAVAANPGGAYNPLFIYGPSGLGKTHLLFAIREHVLSRNPSANIVYIKGDQFTNELIKALADGKMFEFRQRYRYADVFLIDDVQFIGGKTSTQEEFFHTFNALSQEHKQIVLTSDRPPKEIQTLEERLRTRFESGIIADVQPPELETRIAIIKSKAAQFNLDIPDNVSTFIAEKLKTSIRQLEGVVKKLNITYSLDRSKPTIAMAQAAIKDIMSEDEPLPCTIDKIVEEVARAFDVQVNDIYSDNRSQPVSKARQVAMYCVREVTNISFEAIGNEFGRRDHTTVIYAVQQVKNKIEKQSDYRATVEDIIKNAKNGRA